MKQNDYLSLESCPHCGVANPELHRKWGPITSSDHTGQKVSFWSIYRCSPCGGMVMVHSPMPDAHIDGIWPARQVAAEEVPERAREFLTQALSSRSAPAGAIMLAASAVDAMLKEKDYKTGSLNSRIDAAAKDHLITDEMAAWAHDVRLDANDQRHADENAPLPIAADAAKAIEFASALAQFLFVLPARVERGRRS